MGMFDTVLAQCKCGNSVEFQSKAGNCNLDRFETHAVPLTIAESLDGRTEHCEKCNAALTLHFPKTAPRYVNMVVKQ